MEAFRQMRRLALLGAASGALVLSGCGGGAASTEANAATDPTTAPTPSPTPTPIPNPSPPQAGEVFALGDPGEDISSVERLFAMPQVDGLAWRALWRTVEPTDGAYNWAGLDAVLDAAAANKKRVTLHIASSGGAWPAWLSEVGTATYAGSSPFARAFVDPVPWDPIYVSRYQRMMRQLASHISARGQTGLVRAVSVGAPVAEMSLVGCVGGRLGTGPEAVAYSRNSYLAAWTGTAQAVLDAFPNTPVVVSAPVTQICAPDGDGAAFYGDLLHGLGRAQVFVADLDAQGSARYGQVAADLRSRSLLVQTVWSATNDPSNRLGGSLTSAVCAGRNLGARYFEIYKSDLESGDPSVRTAITQARGTTACP